MRTLAIATAAYVALPAQQALACAVCFAGRDETRVAYLMTTLFMTSLPLFALAAGIIWVVRKANAGKQSPPR